MCQSGFDFVIDIFLDLCPFFRLCGRVFGDQRAKIARFHGGYDPPLRDGVEVIDD
jgi:hypothetical protein